MPAPRFHEDKLRGHDDVGALGYSTKRRTTMQVFCPPNPKLLDRTISTFWRRATLGT